MARLGAIVLLVGYCLVALLEPSHGYYEKVPSDRSGDNHLTDSALNLGFRKKIKSYTNRKTNYTAYKNPNEDICYVEPMSNLTGIASPWADVMDRAKDASKLHKLTKHEVWHLMGYMPKYFCEYVSFYLLLDPTLAIKYQDVKPFINEIISEQEHQPLGVKLVDEAKKSDWPSRDVNLAPEMITASPQHQLDKFAKKKKQRYVKVTEEKKPQLKKITGGPKYQLDEVTTVEPKRHFNLKSDNAEYAIRNRRSARFQGQTQSQYLNVMGDDKARPEGKAEAEATQQSSRASVSGSSGMGQAQSMSSGADSCDGCQSYDRIGTLPASIISGQQLASRQGVPTANYTNKK